MSRYYSQTYQPLDDPDWNPNLEPEHELHDPSESHVDLPSSYEPYRAHPDDAPLNRDGTAYQQPGPSAYLNSRYPQRGVKGLKSKHWDKWSGRKKLIVVGSLLLFLIIVIAVAVPVTVEETKAEPFSYTQSFAQVTNETAFASGAAQKESPQQKNDGIGSGSDTYTYYSGDASNFPDSSKWVSYESMWLQNFNTIQTSCKTLGEGADNTETQIQDIAQAIRNRSSVSLVDHRFILAVILQESGGCVHAGSTTSSSGIKNPGLMQSHNGDSFNSDHQQLSILAMVQDGVQGTADGDGLVQLLNIYGNPYAAARIYNTGSIPADGNLSGAGATACYVSDIANRLTGWTTAPNQCPEEKEEKGTT